MGGIITEEMGNNGFAGLMQKADLDFKKYKKYFFFSLKIS